MNFRKLGVVAAATLTIGAGGTIVADRQINPYDDKGSHYELSLKSDIPQGEHGEIAKDRAAMTLKGWNDEYAITIEPQIPTVSFGAAKKFERPFTVTADRPLLSKKMEYRSGDMTAFIEPKEGTENEFDIDFTLHSKPDTNVFEYKIEGAEDFDFFYQPELTQEELAEGASRPENVVGSYAVYHKTKANHRGGSTNYATGKVFHIYRPKAVDANGEEAWAELSYNNGVLSVNVPQKFLDDAVYPVRIDPTFGYTTAGGTEIAFINTTVKACSLVSAYVASTGDTITLISWNGRQFGVHSNTRDVGIYSVVTGNPSTLLASTTITLSTGAPDVWNDTSSISYSPTAGTQYCVAFGNFRGTSAGTDADVITYDAGSAPGRINSTATTLDTSFKPTGADSGRHYSIYATYTAGAAGGGSSSTPRVIIFE